MSSPTVLFVLKDILHNRDACNDVVAMAFGPGFMNEMLIFKKRTC